MFELLALKQADTESFIASKANEGTPIDSMSKKTLREEVKKWKADHKQHSNQVDSSQNNSDDVSLNDLKKVKQLFDLVNQLTALPDLDRVIQKFTDNNHDETQKYFDSIQQLNNLISNSISH